MSFEKKLYDIEVSPPQMVWENISIALDDVSFENNFKKKLVGINAEPPVTTWNLIEKKIGGFEPNKSIADKLNRLSEIPPPANWNLIEAVLDDGYLTEKFARYLNALEVVPPEKNWQNIISELDSKIPVVPFTKKYNAFIQYAAAAVIIGFIAWGGIRLLNTGGINKSNEVAVTKSEPVPPVSMPKTQNTDVKAEDNNSVSLVQDEQTNFPKKNLTNLTKGENKIKSGSRSSNDVLIASLNTFQNDHSGTEEIIADVNNTQQNKRVPMAGNNTDTTAPRYLVYLNEEGSLMKVSKKLADLKCIYSKDGEIPQDILASLDKQICTDLVKTWQEKLAKSPFSSFDPLELADILK